MLFSLLNQVSTFSIFAACMIGIFRFGKVLPAYRPFLLFIWVGAGNELLSVVCISVTDNNVPNSNIYVLMEYLLLLYVFYNWNLAKTRKTKIRYLLLLSGGLSAWILDNLVVNSLFTINCTFRVIYSIIILLLSINQINKLTVFAKKKVTGDAMFQICMAFAFYFSYKAFIETFYILEMPFSKPFYLNCFIILLIINLLTNLIYAIAVLCMPTKREFILPY